jgi:hypothetical protein
MDFLNHRKEGIVFYQVSFLLYRNCKRLLEIVISSKAAEEEIS